MSEIKTHLRSVNACSAPGVHSNAALRFLEPAVVMSYLMCDVVSEKSGINVQEKLAKPRKDMSLTVFGFE